MQADLRDFFYRKGKKRGFTIGNRFILVAIALIECAKIPQTILKISISDYPQSCQ
jgi:hypothetical protein